MTEYDPERPWIVLSSTRGQVTLPDEGSFYEWAQEHWPWPRVAPESMPKRNSGPILCRGPMGDDAALSRLATS